MTLSAQAAAIAHLTAEVERLTRENEQLAAQAVIDSARLRKLLASMPVVRTPPLATREVQS